MSKPALENHIKLITYNRDSLLIFQNELNHKIETDEDFINQMILQGNNQMQLMFNPMINAFEFVKTPPENNLISIKPYDLIKGIDNCNKYLDGSIKQLDEVIRFLNTNFERYADC